MSVSHPPKNGLLLLLQAARKLDEEESLHRYPHSSEKWEHKHSQRNYEETNISYSYSNNYGSQRRPVTSVRCTHNELEKSRRAHLRTCMETLKERLNFDNDVPRITMLTVLKKATATIQLLKQKKQCLESYEDSEKQRCVQLLKRRQALRKKLEEKRSRSLKLQSWKERNRNCSECSIATTSSDDSEMDLRSGSNLVAQSVNNGAQIPNTAAAGLNTCANDPSYTLHVSKHRSLSSPTGTMSSSPVGLDAFDASSSDSGFEEITITSSGIMPQSENSMAYCINDRSQCVSVYPSKHHNATNFVAARHSSLYHHPYSELCLHFNCRFRTELRNMFPCLSNSSKYVRSLVFLKYSSILHFCVDAGYVFQDALGLIMGLSGEKASEDKGLTVFSLMGKVKKALTYLVLTFWTGFRVDFFEAPNKRLIQGAFFRRLMALNKLTQLRIMDEDAYSKDLKRVIATN
ncbi:unnamed protein product [Heterobilharzia americana]|nr:unnamed protein product [Heterobilharzia americana]